MIRKNPIHKNLKKRRSKLKGICTNTKEDIQKIVEHYEDLSDAVFLQQIQLIMQEYTSKMIQAVKNLIIEGVNDSILTTLTHYKDTAPVIISKQALKRIQHQKAEQFNTHTFKGATFQTRIEKLEKRVQKNVRKEIEFANKHDLDRKDLIERLHERFYSEGVIRGGTLKGSGDTLLVGEVTRLYHESSLAFFEYVGVNFVRFCLTPQHNTSDICNKLASYTDKTLEFRFKEKGINPQGVYRLEDLPDYPHPRALYYFEPIYEFGISPLLQRL